MRSYGSPVFGLAVLWVAVLAPDLSGQLTGSVTGRVTSSSGSPLSAVQVYIPDSGRGALTNDAGRFLLLEVPAGTYELTAELVGFRTVSKTLSVVAGSAAVVDFVLTPAPIILDEVVVTGTGGEARKRQLGNTVATLDATEVAYAPVTSFSEMIQGREPSVMSLTSDGATGSGARIRIRGSNSISMSNEPLVYVDGIRVDNSGDMERSGRFGDVGSRLDDVNWEAVERVEILKGAAAATLYGSEASSGVIQIFTRSGTPGGSRMAARVEGGLSRYPDRIAPNAGFARTAAQAESLSELYGFTIEPFQVFEREFTRDLFETGAFRAASLDASGGDADGRITYFLAGRYSYDDGPLGGEELGAARDRLTRIQGNASLTFQPRESLTLRFSTGYTDTGLETFVRNNNVGSPTSAAMTGKPERAYCDSGVQTGVTFGATTPVCEGTGNPVGSAFGSVRELMQQEAGQDARHFSGTVSGEWSAGNGIRLRGLMGLDQVDEDWGSMWPYGWRIDGASSAGIPDEGLRQIQLRSHREVTVDVSGGWTTRVGRDLSSELTLGGQRFLSETDALYSFGAIFPAPGVEVLQAAQNTDPSNDFWSRVSLGAYVQEQLGYRDWLFATLGARFDRSSAFGQDAESALYPKAGLSAVVSELPRWSVGWLPTLRVRAAYGRSGLQPGAFDRFTTFAPVQTATGGGFEPQNLGNPDLRPERTGELELGVEGELFRGRVGFDVTYWDRVTEDALILRPYAAAGGFVDPQLDNIGRIEAHGWEFQVSGLAFQRGGVSLNLSANAAYLWEQVASTGGVPSITVSGSYQRHRNVIEEGLAPGTFVGGQMIPVCGPEVTRVCYTPGSTVPYDLDRDGNPDTVDQLEAFLTSMDAVNLFALGPMLDDEDGDGLLLDHVLGKPTPDWQGSVGADLTLGSRVTVNTVFEYRAGGYSVSNLTGAFRNSNPGIGRNVRRAAEVESTLSNPATRTDGQARVDAAMAWATELVSLAPYSGLNLVEPGDFVRWRELGVTYRVPERATAGLRLQDLTLTFAARNLWLWTRYSGTDPEANEMGRCGGGGEAQNAIQCNFLEATDMFTLPLQQRFSFSVRAVF